MSTEQSFETKRIDHLGIVAGICHEIGLIETINQAVGPSERRVSCGAAVQAMVLNGLGFASRALYLMPQYLNNKPVDLLVAPELVAEDFNDDTLGRSLVFARVAQYALATYGIEHRFFHLDSSSFHLHGQYSVEEAEKEAIEITFGYSKEQRPDLKQVVVNLITGHGSLLPVWMEALSGNSSDKESFPESIHGFCRQLKIEESCYFVVDSALYTAGNLESLGDIRWLTRVPETLTAAKGLVANTDAEQMTALEDGYAYLERPSDYGGIAQRWLLVYSPIAAQREEKTLQRRVEKEEKAAKTAWRKLTGQTFNCAEDAEAALAECQKRWKYHQAEAEVRPVTRFSAPGRPAAGTRPDVVGYQLRGEVLLSETKMEKARGSLGRFVLATNEPDPLRLSPEMMLSEYKAQAVSVERGFRFLKDPLFFADSLFLKNPSRIMALMMIMVLSLLVYSLAERKLRRQLADTGQSVPNQLGKETQTPTMRWVFQVFEGIDLLIIRQKDQIETRQALNLKQEHLTVLHLLGPPVEKCYLLTT